ncbi:MAG TPA: class I SAM-dependent methyltransferase, partial [Kofleriaceae bacterium]|nr:class I SAM-dependent methyltransferase [Kofleriaceae bacterium]
MEATKPPVAYYDAQYGNLASNLYAEVRGDTFDVDLGQTGWITVEEQDLFIGWLGLSPGTRLLDIACGSGGPMLRIAQQTGCDACGIDLHDRGLAQAAARASSAGLGERVTFRQADASQPLPFPDGSADAIICIDAINHLPDRRATFRDWARLLRPGGRLVFTDPIVVTGPVSHEELAIRSSIGFYLYVPRDLNERLLAESGFEIRTVADRTENMASVARRWHDARARRATALRELEGAQTFEGQQRFFDVTARVAAERRLSRIAV